MKSINIAVLECGLEKAALDIPLATEIKITVGRIHLLFQETNGNLEITYRNPDDGSSHRVSIHDNGRPLSKKRAMNYIFIRLMDLEISPSKEKFNEIVEQIEFLAKDLARRGEFTQTESNELAVSIQEIMDRNHLIKNL